MCPTGPQQNPGVTLGLQMDTEGPERVQRGKWSWEGVGEVWRKLGGPRLEKRKLRRDFSLHKSLTGRDDQGKLPGNKRQGDRASSCARRGSDWILGRFPHN